MSTASPFDHERLRAIQGFTAAAAPRENLMDGYPYPAPGSTTPQSDRPEVVMTDENGTMVVRHVPLDEAWPDAQATKAAERHSQRLANREAAVAAGRLLLGPDATPVGLDQQRSTTRPMPLPRRRPTPYKRQPQTSRAPGSSTKKPAQPKPVELSKAERHETSPLRFKFGGSTLAKPKMNNVGYAIPGDRRYVKINKHGSPEDNEDSFYTDPRSVSLGVFDGLGGYNQAREASQTANGTIQEVLRTQGRPKLDQFLLESRASRAGAPEGAQTRQARENMRQALNAARHEVDKLGEGATTASVVHVAEKPCVLEDGTETSIVPIVVGHVGDSKVFVIRENILPDGRKERRIGELTRDQGDGGNQLTNCIGRGHDNMQDTVSIFMVGRGSRILVCTDGITGDSANDHVNPREILDVATSPDPNTAARDLIKYAGYDHYRGTVYHKDQPDKVLYHIRGKWDDKAVAIMDIE